MSMYATKTNLRQSQDGFAALVIALVLILVLSLITVGFAELMRQEERSALDKHLSNQAYYAAETGINDATKAINNGFIGPKSNCAPFNLPFTNPGEKDLSNATVGGDPNIAYTCLLIDPAPTTLEYDPITSSKSEAIKITGTDFNYETRTAPIEDLVISWDSGPVPGFVTAAGHPFETSGNWPYAGVLRIGLTPLIGSLDRQSLINNTYTAFLYPNNDASGTALPTIGPYANGTGINSGVILDGNCNNSKSPRACSVTITNINVGGSNPTDILLDMRSVYANTKVTIIAKDSAGQLREKNAQTLVDSTGKAQDVLRRVLVRVPSSNSYSHPAGGLETTGNVCKQLQLAPASSTGPPC